MDWQLLFLSFSTIFLSELGDKSQIATIGLSGKSDAPRYVFLGSSLALIMASLIGVVLGDSAAQFLPARLLKAVAAIVFAGMALRLLMGEPEVE
jgi:Ca2+/H+ antiporter, TMEM165/GDT1 family